MMKKDNKKLQNLFLVYVCIFVLSLFYRLYGLGNRGYFPGSDAPGYACVVKTYRAGFDYIVKTKILKQDIGSMNDYLYENGGQFFTGAKDGIIPIGLVGSIIFGNNTNTFLYSSAIFGVFTVLLLFLILLRTIRLFYAFLISLLFAVSPFHVGLSREGLTVTFSCFFLLAGIYSYIRFLESNNSKDLYLCGLALGFSFLCHYSIAIFIVVFFAYEIYYLFLRRGSVKRILGLGIFAFFPLFLTDLFTRMVKLYGTFQHINMIDRFLPYFNDLFTQVTIVGKYREHISAINFIHCEGIILFILLIISILFIVRGGIKADCCTPYFLVFLFILPFIFSWKLDLLHYRHMLNFIPLGYIIIGYGLNNLANSKFGKVFILIIMIAIVSNALRSLDYFNYRSNFEQAINYMKRNKGVKHITTVWSLSRLYAGRKNVINYMETIFLEYPNNSGTALKVQIEPLSMNEIKLLYKAGYNYLLINIPPLFPNELTNAAMAIEPEYSTNVMVCNGVRKGYDIALLRDRKDTFPYRFNVYDLGKVINGKEKNARM